MKPSERLHWVEQRKLQTACSGHSGNGAKLLTIGALNLETET